MNQHKLNGVSTSAEKNVVMGQSMGGLVSRYGLAEMAKGLNNRPDPHTRLLILHDSPQRGANNPVGVQSLTRSFDVPFLFGKSVASLLGQIRATLRVLNEPATQQLSILNAFNGRGDIRANTFIPDVFQPMITFSSPAPYDIIAVSNGSQCGRPQNTPVGVALAESSLALLLPLPTPLTGEFASYGLPAYGQQATISRVDLRIEYQIAIGICPACITIPIRYHLLRESGTSPANTLPLETLPGGSTNPHEQAGSCADGFDFGSLNGVYAAYFRTNIYNGDICFVPTYSALDVQTVTSTTAYAKYINNITDNPSTPNVLRYVAQENVNNNGTQFNTAHISFTPRNSEWIFNEMQRPFNGGTNSAGCTTECLAPADIAFDGPSTVCGNTTYTTPDRGVGYTYFWSATPAYLFTNATGTGTTFTTSNTSTSNGTITLQIMGDCPRTLTKSVTVGLPHAEILGLTVVDCNNPGENYTISPFYPNLTYTVHVTGDATFKPTGYQDSGTFALSFASGPGSAHITVNVSSSCGSDETKTNVDITGASCRPAARAALYPNPATESVDVHLDHADAAHPVTVRLFDSYGRPHAEQTSTGPETVRLNTAQLPAGLYFVHILRGSEVLSREQLRIEK